MTCDIYVETSPAQVWELISDIHLPPRLSPELQRVEWIDGADHPEVGARFLGHNKHPRLGEWCTASQITTYERPRTLGWVVTDADGRFAGPEGGATVTSPAATWLFELTPESTGTRLRHSVRIGPGRSGLSFLIDQHPEHEEQFVEARLGELRANIESALRGIKRLAEGPADQAR
ncbi:SRPBCC family protein [Micromonospora radicis]|uniref:SRPBCC family protein n=1 Tax=Micromonospora radicis TaxID=1894971 RepID=UPI0018F6A8D2|nr:SRPBCC family protein [Micromonospora radicis]